MKRIEDFPHIHDAMKRVRNALGLKQLRRADWWAAMDAKRKTLYLKRAQHWQKNIRIDVKLGWYDFMEHERIAIQQAVTGICKRAMEDCYALGVGVPELRRQAE